MLLKVLIMLSASIFVNSTVPNSYSLSSFVYSGTKDNNCGDKTCIRKCCQPNYHISDASCVFSNTNQFSVTVYEENHTVINDAATFSIVSGIMDCANSNQYRLEPNTHKEDAFLVQKDGRLYHPLTKTYIESGQYCLDNFDDIQFSAIVCANQGYQIGRGLNFIGENTGHSASFSFSYKPNFLFQECWFQCRFSSPRSWSIYFFPKRICTEIL